MTNSAKMDFSFTSLTRSGNKCRRSFFYFSSSSLAIIQLRAWLSAQKIFDGIKPLKDEGERFTFEANIIDPHFSDYHIKVIDYLQALQRITYVDT